MRAQIGLAAGGVVIDPFLSDLLGPAFLLLPKDLAVNVTPTPVTGVHKTYTVTAAGFNSLTVTLL